MLNKPWQSRGLHFIRGENLEDRFRIGIITSTHGIKGEVKVFPTTDDIKRFDYLEKCFLEDGTELKKKGVKYFKNMVILAFDGIDSIEDAEKLMKKEIYVSREDAIPLNEGEYYVADLMGADVYDEADNKLGVLKDYLETGANDVYVIENEQGGQFMVPVVPFFIKKVDVVEKKMIIHLIDGML